MVIQPLGLVASWRTKSDRTEGCTVLAGDEGGGQGQRGERLAPTLSAELVLGGGLLPWSGFGHVFLLRSGSRSAILGFMRTLFHLADLGCILCQRGAHGVRRRYGKVRVFSLSCVRVLWTEMMNQVAASSSDVKVWCVGCYGVCLR